MPDRSHPAGRKERSRRGAAERAGAAYPRLRVVGQRAVTVAGDASPRLRTTRDVRAVLAARMVGRTPAVWVHAAPRSSARSRYTVVAGRALGGAVVRNRAKRRLRAVMTEQGVPPAHDVVLTARPEAVTMAFPKLCADVARATERAVTARG